jgi:DNA invertase Pin-like site-specific DNA recombinase
MDTFNQTPIIYFLYARKSTESEDRQIQSIDDQIKALLALAKTHNWKIKEIFRESYSAKNPYARPIFNDMLARIEKGEANGILCWQTNRLSRNPIDSARVQWLLQKSIILSIQTIEGERKPSDNALLLSVEAGVANQYIIDLVKNVRRGLYSKAEKGWLPCRAPIGYMNDREQRTIIPDPERFHLVRRLWDLLLTSSYSVNQLAHIAIHDWGLTLRKTRRYGGNPIAISRIYAIFSNPFYRGTLVYGGKTYQGNHIPMVTFQEYDRAQDILGRSEPRRNRRHALLYRGLFRCGDCGCTITGEIKNKRIKSTGEIRQYTYYRCTRKNLKNRCAQRGGIREEEFTKQIDEFLGRYSISQEFYTVARNWITNEQSHLQQEREFRVQQMKLTKDNIQDQLTNLMRLRYRDQINDEQYNKEKEILEKRLREIDYSIDDRNQLEQTLLIKALDFALYAKEVFKNNAAVVRRDIIRGLGSNRTLFDKKLNIEASEWLKPLSESSDNYVSEDRWLEPQESLMVKAQKTPYMDRFPVWWSSWEAIRTILDDPTKEFYIPTLDAGNDKHDEDLRNAG